jgi:hypothetical protein
MFFVDIVPDIGYNKSIEKDVTESDAGCRENTPEKEGSKKMIDKFDGLFITGGFILMALYVGFGFMTIWTMTH